MSGNLCLGVKSYLSPLCSMTDFLMLLFLVPFHPYKSLQHLILLVKLGLEIWNLHFENVWKKSMEFYQTQIVETLYG